MVGPYFVCPECGNTLAESDVIARLPSVKGDRGGRIVLSPVQPSCVHDGVPLPMVRRGS